MNFNSLQFLIFLPVVVILYWLLPHKFRWVLLLIASYYFYMSWNARLVFLIAGTTLISYVAGLVIERTERKGLRRFWLIATLVVCFGVLIFFKYFNFLLDSVFAVVRLFSPSAESPVLDILLPVGISFYTFQTLSYVIDVYRGSCAAERHIGYYALFVSYFPQLVAGPIERPENLIPQLRAPHTFDREDLAAGLRILLVGFFRKCVIADTIAVFVDSVFADLSAANGLAVALAGLLFTVQMYNDFAGYSDIATGSARLMGVRLMKNFDKPLTATSFSDFFRRWHISLTLWFTDYVYIPLGGSRRGTARKILNTFIVFALCGLWHGASWTYVLWGLYAALMISLETLLRRPCKALAGRLHIRGDGTLSVLLRHGLMLLLFIPAAILFRAPTVADIGTAFAQLFTAVGWGAGFFDAAFAALSMQPIDFLIAALCVVCMAKLVPLGSFSARALPAGGPRAGVLLGDARRASAYLYGVLAVAVGWMILIAAGDSSAFAYFQF